MSLLSTVLVGGFALFWVLCPSISVWSASLCWLLLSGSWFSWLFHILVVSGLLLLFRRFVYAGLCLVLSGVGCCYYWCIVIPVMVSMVWSLCFVVWCCFGCASGFPFCIIWWCGVLFLVLLAGWGGFTWGFCWCGSVGILWFIIWACGFGWLWGILWFFSYLSVWFPLPNSRIIVLVVELLLSSWLAAGISGFLMPLMLITVLFFVAFLWVFCCLCSYSVLVEGNSSFLLGSSSCWIGFFLLPSFWVLVLKYHSMYLGYYVFLYSKDLVLVSFFTFIFVALMSSSEREVLLSTL